MKGVVVKKIYSDSRFKIKREACIIPGLFQRSKLLSLTVLTCLAQDLYIMGY